VREGSLDRRMHVVDSNNTSVTALRLLRLMQEVAESVKIIGAYEVYFRFN
jgi:hypothetical protein